MEKRTRGDAGKQKGYREGGGTLVMGMEGNAETTPGAHA